MRESIAERLNFTSELINTGRWDRALEQARADSQDPELARYARTWFLLALIEGLHGTTEARSAAHAGARECTDYTEKLAGDFLRDDAITLLKKGHLEAARESVDHARTLHKHDRNRQVCLDMVTGRIQLHAGHYDEAYKTLRGAAKEWKEMGAGANRQWRTNLQLHLLMAAVMSGRMLRAWLLLPRLLWLDRNRRRWLAALACLGGKRACSAVLRRH